MVTMVMASDASTYVIATDRVEKTDGVSQRVPIPSINARAVLEDTNGMVREYTGYNGGKFYCTQYNYIIAVSSICTMKAAVLK